MMERLVVKDSFECYTPKEMLEIGDNEKIDYAECCATQCQLEEGNCADCPVQKCFNRLAQYEDTGLTPEEIERLKNGGWIPVSERLPEESTLVLTWAKSTARGGDICFVGSYYNKAWFLQSSAGTLSYPSQYKAVAWQPLPEPYKERD